MLQFYSTNNINHKVNLQEAIFNGLAPDNGLYMPTEINKLDNKIIESLSNLNLQEISFEISNLFLKDYLTKNKIEDIIKDAINFDVPLINIEDNISMLELFHGPTCAFKDFGGRFMSRLMKQFLTKKNKKTYILVATSGDTGSAVANGFYNVDGIEVIILYPSKKVSNIQEQQLTTLGKNIKAIEIEGTFDDCQSLVKKAFLDNDIKKNIDLTSANSINIARLIPQSFYYAYATAKNYKKNEIIFSIPSGNYGNLTAGLIAKKIGIPIKLFIAASNINNIVPKYLESGNFLPKPSINTISNAMDVGNPSNFVRMTNLYNNNLEHIKKEIVGYSFNDEETKQAILNVYNNNKYILDPHGAIAYLGVKNYLKKQKNNELFIALETAHPAKFGDIVNKILDIKIKIPEQLENCLKLDKKSILMKADFNIFKEYLINLK